MEVEEGRARGQGLVSEQGGIAWYFCSPGCKQAFDRDPKAAADKARGATEKPEKRTAARVAGMMAFHAEDPVCGMDVDPDEAARGGLMSSYEGAPFSFCSRVQAGFRPGSPRDPLPARG